MFWGPASSMQDPPARPGQNGKAFKVPFYPESSKRNPLLQAIPNDYWLALHRPNLATVLPFFKAQDGINCELWASNLYF